MLHVHASAGAPARHLCFLCAPLHFEDSHPPPHKHTHTIHSQPRLAIHTRANGKGIDQLRRDAMALRVDLSVLPDAEDLDEPPSATSATAGSTTAEAPPPPPATIASAEGAAGGASKPVSAAITSVAAIKDQQRALAERLSNRFKCHITLRDGDVGGAPLQLADLYVRVCTSTAVCSASRVKSVVWT
jgi:hypothetical protein